jgi:hypothetical protein
MASSVPALLPGVSTPVEIMGPLRTPRGGLSAVVRGSLPPGFVREHGDLLAALPPSLGTIRKISLPPAGSRTAPIVVHIQDVHRNLEAQRRIAGLIQNLIDHRQADLVALEGSEGPYDLDRFRRFPDRESLRLAADDMLADFQITGPIHTALTSPANIPPFVGVDDEAHYAANVEAFRRASPRLADVKARLALDRSELEREKERVYSPALLSLDRQTRAYHERRLSLGDYVRVLARGAPSLTPALRDFLEALRAEAILDFRAVERQRARVVEACLRSLSKTQSTELFQYAAAYRAGEVTYGDFYSHLRDLGRKCGVDFKKYTAFDAYVLYVLAADRVDGEALYRDLAVLEKAELLRRASTPGERNLVVRSRTLSLAEKLADFSLTPEEWTEYESVSSRRAPELGDCERFYQEAGARDHAMGENLNLFMRMKNDGEHPSPPHVGEGGAKLRMRGGFDGSVPPIAILVTGGWHAPGIEDRLRRAGAVVVSVVPSLEKVDTPSGAAYLGVFTREKSPLEQLLQAEKLFLTEPPFSPAAHAGVALRTAAASKNPESGLRLLLPGNLLAALGKVSRRVVDGTIVLSVRLRGGTIKVSFTPGNALNKFNITATSLQRGVKRFWLFPVTLWNRYWPAVDAFIKSPLGQRAGWAVLAMYGFGGFLTTKGADSKALKDGQGNNFESVAKELRITLVNPEESFPGKESDYTSWGIKSLSVRCVPPYRWPLIKGERSSYERFSKMTLERLDKEFEAMMDGVDADIKPYGNYDFHKRLREEEKYKNSPLPHITVFLDQFSQDEGSREALLYWLQKPIMGVARLKIVFDRGGEINPAQLNRFIKVKTLIQVLFTHWAGKTEAIVEPLRDAPLTDDEKKKYFDKAEKALSQAKSVWNDAGETFDQGNNTLRAEALSFLVACLGDSNDPRSLAGAIHPPLVLRNTNLSQAVERVQEMLSQYRSSFWAMAENFAEEKGADGYLILSRMTGDADPEVVLGAAIKNKRDKALEKIRGKYVTEWIDAFRKAGTPGRSSQGIADLLRDLAKRADMFGFSEGVPGLLANYAVLLEQKDLPTYRRLSEKVYGTKPSKESVRKINQLLKEIRTKIGGLNSGMFVIWDETDAEGLKEEAKSDLKIILEDIFLGVDSYDDLLKSAWKFSENLTPEEVRNYLGTLNVTQKSFNQIKLNLRQKELNPKMVVRTPSHAIPLTINDEYRVLRVSSKRWIGKGLNDRLNELKPKLSLLVRDPQHGSFRMSGQLAKMKGIPFGNQRVFVRVFPNEKTFVIVCYGSAGNLMQDKKSGKLRRHVWNHLREICKADTVDDISDLIEVMERELKVSSKNGRATIPLGVRVAEIVAGALGALGRRLGWGWLGRLTGEDGGRWYVRNPWVESVAVALADFGLTVCLGSAGTAGIVGLAVGKVLLVAGFVKLHRVEFSSYRRILRQYGFTPGGRPLGMMAGLLYAASALSPFLTDPAVLAALWATVAVGQAVVDRGEQGIVVRGSPFPLIMAVAGGVSVKGMTMASSASSSGRGSSGSSKGGAEEKEELTDKPSISDLESRLVDSFLAHQSIDFGVTAGEAIKIARAAYGKEGVDRFEKALRVAAQSVIWGGGLEEIIAALFLYLENGGKKKANPLVAAIGKLPRRKEGWNKCALIIKAITDVRRLSYSPVDGSTEAIEDQMGKIAYFLGGTAPESVIRLAMADKVVSLAMAAKEERSRLDKEIREVYAPLAERLGKEDWALRLREEWFRHMEPEAYVKFRADFREATGMTYSQARVWLDGRIRELIRILKNQKIPTRVTGRPKSFYQIFRKLELSRINQDKRKIEGKKLYEKVSDLDDLFGLRVVIGDDSGSSLGINFDQQVKILSGYVQAAFGGSRMVENQRDRNEEEDVGFNALFFGLEPHPGSEKNHRIEIQIMTEEDELKYKRGPRAKWVHSARKESEAQQFHVPSSPLTGSLAKDVRLFREGMNQHVYVDILENGHLRSLRFPRGAIVADALAHRAVDALKTPLPSVQLVEAAWKDSAIQRVNKPRLTGPTHVVTTGETFILNGNASPFPGVRWDILRGEAQTPRAKLMTAVQQTGLSKLVKEGRHKMPPKISPDEMGMVIKPRLKELGLRDIDELWAWVASLPGKEGENLVSELRERLGRKLIAYARPTSNRHEYSLVIKFRHDRPGVLRDILNKLDPFEMNVTAIESNVGMVGSGGDILITVQSDQKKRLENIRKKIETIPDVPMKASSQGTIPMVVKVKADEKPGLMMIIAKVLGEFGVNIHIPRIQVETSNGTRRARLTLTVEVPGEIYPGEIQTKLASEINTQFNNVEIEVKDQLESSLKNQEVSRNDPRRATIPLGVRVAEIVAGGLGALGGRLGWGWLGRLTAESGGRWYVRNPWVESVAVALADFGLTVCLGSAGTAGIVGLAVGKVLLVAGFVKLHRVEFSSYRRILRQYGFTPGGWKVWIMAGLFATGLILGWVVFQDPSSLGWAFSAALWATAGIFQNILDKGFSIAFPRLYAFAVPGYGSLFHLMMREGGFSPGQGTREARSPLERKIEEWMRQEKNGAQVPRAGIVIHVMALAYTAKDPAEKDRILKNLAQVWDRKNWVVEYGPMEEWAGSLLLTMLDGKPLDLDVEELGDLMTVANAEAENPAFLENIQTMMKSKGILAFTEASFNGFLQSIPGEGKELGGTAPAGQRGSPRLFLLPAGVPGSDKILDKARSGDVVVAERGAMTGGWINDLRTRGVRVTVEGEGESVFVSGSEGGKKVHLARLQELIPALAEQSSLTVVSPRSLGRDRTDLPKKGSIFLKEGTEFWFWDVVDGILRVVPAPAPLLKDFDAVVEKLTLTVSAA